MFDNLPKEWKKFLGKEIISRSEERLSGFLIEESKAYTILPPKEEIFNAFKLCQPQSVKVVILGQDPYPREGIAHGLSFSVKKGVKCPASLRNIYNEICADLGKETPMEGDLSRLAASGVLLLNTILTVRKDEPLSHKDMGWEDFTTSVIKKISDENTHVVFMLWGSPAAKYEEYINSKKHLILKSVHPSPLSAYRGFFGCKHFSKANNWLKENGEVEIDW